MDIDSTFSIAESERYLRKISSLSLDEALKIPTNFKNSEIGGDATLIQIISTWAANRPRAAILTYLNNTSDTDLLAFIQRPHGLAIGLCAKMVRDVFERDQLKSIQNSLAQVTQERMIELYYKAIPKDLGDLFKSRGLTVEIFYADHLNFSKPNFFYSYKSLDRELRDTKQFVSITRRILQAVLPATYNELISQDEIESLSIVLRELLQNTDDHAVTDINGDILRLSIRGLIARHHHVDLDNLDRNLQGIPALKTFCERLKQSKSRHKLVQLIEVSIFDSGPGYAQRWLRKSLQNVSIFDEFEAVKQCFEKNASSKSGGYFGQGLPTLTKALRKHKGFLRLRTGRLSLCGDPSMSETDDINLIDSSGMRPTRLAPIIGSLVTIVIPIGTS